MSQPYSGGESAAHYASYTLEELKQALTDLDKDTFPDEAQLLSDLIDNYQSNLEHTSVTQQAVNKERVKFHGSGMEFFSIWIVNLLLSIVTLGIYSAWATVRTNRYFYSNTEIAGHRLAYLATPIQILIGRVIAFALFVIVIVASSFSPIVAVVAALVIAALVPVIIVMGVRFRMRMMAYRNVRFNFTGAYGRAFVVFFLFPIVGVMTLYLALPWVLKKIDEFLYENITYGDKKFLPELSTGEYYVASIVAGLMMFGGFFLFALITGASIAANPEAAANGFDFSFTGIVGGLLYIFTLLIGYSFYEAYIRNHVYNNMRIDEVALFSSDLKVMDLVLLTATNYMLFVCSLGMAYPWVKVRTTRLLASATQISILSGIDTVIAQSGTADNAIADEVIGAFDIDVSLG